MQTTVGRWTIEHDPDATRACYARIAAPYECACMTCENYLALRVGDLPTDFWKLFDSLGIAFHKPAEIETPRPGTRQNVVYGVWYHFVGRIVSGAEGWKPTSETGRMYDGEEIAPGVSLGFSSVSWVMDNAFAGKPIVQLDFQLEVPWVISPHCPV